MRGKILEILEDNTEVKLRYIDSGVEETLPVKHVHSLPERFQIIKPFAIWCRLRWNFLQSMYSLYLSSCHYILLLPLLPIVYIINFH